MFGRARNPFHQRSHAFRFRAVRPPCHAATRNRLQPGGKTGAGEKPPRVAKAVRTGWLAPRPAPESHHRDEMEGFQIKTLRDGPAVGRAQGEPQADTDITVHIELRAGLTRRPFPIAGSRAHNGLARRPAAHKLEVAWP